MRRKASSQNRFMRIITLPIRALSKARDFYVRSMTDYADKVSYGDAMGVYSGRAGPSLPKSFSVGSSRRSDDSDDLRELIRAASARRLGTQIMEELYMRQMAPPSAATTGVVPRSCSVGMGKIDEDRVCEFGEDNVRPELMYPRSRSYAVTKRSVVC
ncbi:hypothetical protein NMG60_11016544 [Bertholletia excelsa]